MKILINSNGQGEAHRYYEQRINRIGQLPGTSRESEIITVINPHLNKYWCEEGFLPSIYPSQRIVDEKNNMRAFFYALTLEKPCCVRLKNTKGKISWWFLRGMDTILRQEQCPNWKFLCRSV